MDWHKGRRRQSEIEITPLVLCIQSRLPLTAALIILSKASSFPLFAESRSSSRVNNGWYPRLFTTSLCRVPWPGKRFRLNVIGRASGNRFDGRYSFIAFWVLEVGKICIRPRGQKKKKNDADPKFLLGFYVLYFKEQM